jgi:DNA-binding PadR family transcriptional regulator
MEERDVDGMLPLSAAVLHILVALAESPRHGYAIAQEVERVTGGMVRMGPGTLYGSIQRMLDAGLIRESAVPAEAAADEMDGRAGRRRYYAVTPLGVRALRAEARRLAEVVRLVESRVG